ncbi:MAG: glutathione S-transferase family protein [Alphaproteobacteria bacterium]|nr:glutathione S-transferase family protein [Alphaproteobacteria bacterium]
MADDLILHHHDPSPFAEKIRKAFGIKRLAWQSVQIPMAMPKPDLTCLTGGYRGTPVLQIGADIYCDTRLIIDVIERRAPTPPLFRSGQLANFGLQNWSDDAVFPPGAALAMHENADNLPGGLIKERQQYFANLDFDRFAIDAPHFRAQFRAQAALVEAQLSDGRDFLFGSAPEWADINAFFPIWMARGHFPSAERLLEGMTRLAAWRDRMDEFGTGARTDLSAEDALAVARRATPSGIGPDTGRLDESGAQPGDAVTVFPVEHPETAVAGRLEAAGDTEIIISRAHERTGDVAIHFPRIGYRINPST